MALNWKDLVDSTDGMDGDDVSAEHLNRLARGIEALEAPARAELVGTTLEQLLDKGEISNNGIISGNRWSVPGADTLIIKPGGMVAFKIASGRYISFKIDGTAFDGTEYEGKADTIIVETDINGSGYIEFEYLKTASYKGGILTKEQAEKLILTEIFSKKEKKELERLSGVGNAEYTLVKTSLKGITTGGSGVAVNSITDTTIAESVNGTYNIDFQGESELAVKFNCFSDGAFYIDDVLIASGDVFDFTWSGTIKQGITLSLYDGTVTFEKFNKVVRADGFMTGEQAEKLGTTQVYTAAEKKKLGDTNVFTNEEKAKLDNTYTKEDMHSLFDAHSIELERDDTALTGDELTTKTADYIHVSKITNNNSVEFGKEFNYSGTQFFGYVGVKKAAVTSGVRYLLVAEVDIETELDIDKINVSGFYRPSGGTGADDTSTSVTVGKLKNGKNYILYPFVARDNEIDGFYMDSHTPGTNMVKFTLYDVRLYRAVIVSRDLALDGLKDWKCDIVMQGDTILSDIGDYVLIRDDGTLYAYSVSGAISADIKLYKPLEEVFATKKALAALSDIVSGKSITYEFYEAGQKCILEPGCFYYLRGNTQSKVFDWYKADGTTLSDGDGNDLGAFKEAFVITTSNNYSGSYVDIALIPTTLSITSKSFYVDVTKPDIYVLSSSASLSVWKVKA